MLKIKSLEFAFEFLPHLNLILEDFVNQKCLLSYKYVASRTMAHSSLGLGYLYFFVGGGFIYQK